MIKRAEFNRSAESTELLQFELKKNASEFSIELTCSECWMKVTVNIAE